MNLTPLTGEEFARLTFVDGPRAGMGFVDVVFVCAREPGLIEQYDRLTGEKFAGLPRSLAGATQDATIGRFLRFVYECVWLRLPPDPAPRGILSADVFPEPTRPTASSEGQSHD